MINIGFLSYDFNSHPTAHLVEAIFYEISKYKCIHTGGCTIYSSEDASDSSAGTGTGSGSQRQHVFDDVRLYIYSYGKDDNSTYRRNLQEVCRCLW